MTLDVAAARARFSALQRDLVFFDGPGGTQVPDEVIDAIAAYLRESNANDERPVRDEPPHRGARRALAGDRSALPRLLSGRDRLRAEHDDAQLRALAHRRARVPAGRRDPRHEARPRRERLAVARARPRPRPDRPLRGHPRRHDARHGRPRAPAHRPDQGGRVPGRLERGRHADRRAADRRARTRGGRDRLGRRGPLRAARTDRRRRDGSRRADLLAVQVLRAAPRARLRPARARRDGGGRTRCGRAGRAVRAPIRDWDAALRAARRLRRRGRVRRVARLDGRDRRLGARARRTVPRRPAGDDPAPRPADDGGPGADVRLLGRRDSRRRRRRPGSASAASPPGTATTTRSR